MLRTVNDQLGAPIYWPTCEAHPVRIHITLVRAGLFRRVVGLVPPEPAH